MLNLQQHFKNYKSKLSKKIINHKSQNQSIIKNFKRYFNKKIINNHKKIYQKVRKEDQIKRIKFKEKK